METWRELYLSPILPQPVRRSPLWQEEEGRVRTCTFAGRLWRVELQLASLYSGRFETLERDEPHHDTWWPTRLTVVDPDAGGGGEFTLDDQGGIAFLLALAEKS